MNSPWVPRLTNYTHPYHVVKRQVAKLVHIRIRNSRLDLWCFFLSWFLHLQVKRHPSGNFTLHKQFLDSGQRALLRLTDRNEYELVPWVLHALMLFSIGIMFNCRKDTPTCVPSQARIAGTCSQKGWTSFLKSYFALAAQLKNQFKKVGKEHKVPLTGSTSFKYDLYLWQRN